MKKKEMIYMCNLSDYVEEIGREDGMKKGKEAGAALILISQIQKKYLRGKPLDVIAEELEEEPAALSVYYNAVTENPHASADKIWENLQKK